MATEMTEPMRIMVHSNLEEFGYKVTRELVNETIDGLIAHPTDTPPNGIIGMFTKDMLVKSGVIEG